MEPVISGCNSIEAETIAVIPARGGSQSIPGKNIRVFAGKPLLFWVLRAANACDAIDRVIVATENREIAGTVDGFAFEKTSIFNRSLESAADTAPSETVLLEIAREMEFKTMVFLQATTPFTSEADIDKALRQFWEKKYDSLLSVVKYKRFLWDASPTGAVPVNYDYRDRPRRQDFEGVYLENGAFYINTRENLLQYKNRLCGRIGLYTMPDYSSIEIDEPNDWDLAEQIFQENIRALNGDGGKRCIT